jgi:ABC transporter substrate binding protein
LADTVAKVENRTTLKISRKLIFRLLCCCLAIQRRYEGPWLILEESIWPLTSPRAKRISGSRIYRSSPQKDFCNNIGGIAARRVTALANANDPFSKPFLEQVQLAGEASGTTINSVRISSNEEFEGAFAAMEKERPDAVIVQPSLPSKRAAELALKHRVPAVSVPRWFAEEGGLMSYSARFADLYRKAAVYVDKILKGAQPADLPVEQPTIFELVINLKTAKALGLTVPEVLLVRADKLIE